MEIVFFFFFLCSGTKVLAVSGLVPFRFSCKIIFLTEDILFVFPFCRAGFSKCGTVLFSKMGSPSQVFKQV
uniref:Putative secreted protein n=1 Tax=Ixodes ricinus TaxID=34613 RepID=A0A6B0TS11_IXORI